MRSSRFTCFRVIVELLHERVLNFCVYCLGPAPKLVDPAIVAGPKMAAHRCATLYCSAHGRVSGWSRGYNCHFNKELNLLFNCLPGTARLRGLSFVYCIQLRRPYGQLLCMFLLSQQRLSLLHCRRPPLFHTWSCQLAQKRGPWRQ